MKTLSISDDDLCSTCKFYHPELDGLGGWCDFNFPCEKDEDGYVVSCEQYQQIDYPEQNWNLTP